MSLGDIYGTVPQICFMDVDGVYLGDKKVSLDNTRNSGYIRYNANTSYEAVGRCAGDYQVTRDLVFAGCAPYADSDLLLRATTASLAGGGVEILESTIDKQAIAESENIDRDQLAKFKGVAMVWVRYRTVTMETLDPSCTYDLCTT